VEKTQQDQHIYYSNELTSLKAKAGIIGAISGAVGSVVVAVVIAISANFVMKQLEDNPKDTTKKEEKVSYLNSNIYKPHHIFT
jgi:hypothetical protein